MTWAAASCIHGGFDGLWVGAWEGTDMDTHHPPSAQDDVPKLPSLNSCKLTSLLKTPRGTYTLSSTPLLRETDRRLHEQEGDFEEATA
ncbi:hypothetical protein CVT26_001018 [Gymnopilus dilepis]|uniref:Uncharacterized protein n=1 Tax=Gymnopilus dilepis TaxID=231916 RepID=A0A409Y243_9AGAR|nr:hypothetical protein CVT26_001018 [Gymnopilus dilepis]